MDNPYRAPAGEENLLDDPDIDRARANRNIRFSNLLIDRLVLFLSWYYLLGGLVGAWFVDLGWITDDDIPLFGNCFFIIFDLFYFTVFETVLGGRTIGKLLTRSRAVNADGTVIGFKKALLRSLCRMVPFEVFSALGYPCYPWHDKWTKTLVIDEEKAHLAR